MEPWTGRATKGALPQNPDSMPPPHHAGAPTTPHSPHKQEAEARQACFLHQAPDKPTTPAPTTQAGNQSTSRPAFREEQPRPAQTHTAAQTTTTRKPPPHNINP